MYNKRRLMSSLDLPAHPEDFPGVTFYCAERGLGANYTPWQACGGTWQPLGASYVGVFSGLPAPSKLRSGAKAVVTDSPQAPYVEYTNTGTVWLQKTYYPSAANTLALVGDSRLALWRSVAATISEQNPKAYLPWALAYSGNRMTVVNDQSLGGSQFVGAGTGTDIVLTQLPLALASQAQHLLVEGGVNDFFQAGTSLATVQAAVVSLIQQATAAGMVVWIMTSIHPNSAYSAYSVSAQAKLAAYNSWLKTRVASQYAKFGVHIVDLSGIVIDGTSTTLSAQTNFLYDNIHPRNLGGMPAGAELARVWNLYVPEVPRLLNSNADNQTYSATSDNILDNGLFVNGVTLATGFTSTVTGTGGVTDTLAARGDNFGNFQHRVVTFAANNDSARMFTSDVKARVSNGDVLEMCVEVTPSSMTATRCIRVQLTLTGATTSLTATTMQLDSINDLAMTSTTKMMLKTNPITVNTGTLGALTIVQGNIAAFGTGAGGVTLDIGRWSIRKLPSA